MLKKRFLFATLVVLSVVTLFTYLTADGSHVFGAGVKRTWITVDYNELKTMQDLAARDGRTLSPKIVDVENGIAVVRATDDEISLISEHAHKGLHKCAGFTAHTDKADALMSIKNIGKQQNATAITYTIDNSAAVNPIISDLTAGNIMSTISSLSTGFNTRYYNSPTGLQSATWIKDKWTALANGRSDITVEFFNHTWQQPSVIMTIQGTTAPSEVVVLGAHQDSIRSGCSGSTTCQTLTAPGADDDASGVASLTEVIRVAMAKNYRPAKTVKFMAYAGEEAGLLGSKAIATSYQASGVNVIGALQLDMTDYKAAGTDIAMVTDYTNADQNTFVRNLAATYLPSLVVTNTTCGYSCSDHYSWTNKGYAASFPFEAPLGSDNPYIHTANDTIANSDSTGAHALKFSKLAAAYMAELAKGSLVIVDNFSKPVADFDGDGRSDLSVFRPSTATWHLQRSTSGYAAAQFGLSTDKLVPGDFDGDGKADIAVFRDGTWYSILSQTSSFSAVNFGLAGDIPTSKDFDGDGKADMTVFRNGTWYLLKSNGAQFSAIQFGLSSDVPVAADFDGDGKADPAVFRSGTWYILGSTAGFSAIQFGISTDRPVPADYDGDGKADAAVYRDGTWYIQRSTSGFMAMQFGLTTDTPSPGDYDGDGKADPSVYRGGTWYLQRSTAGFASAAFGESADKPVPAAYIP